MIHYRDMTFCTFYVDCRKASKCERALKPEVKIWAKNTGLPIACFVDKPDCFNKKKVVENV